MKAPAVLLTILLALMLPERLPAEETDDIRIVNGKVYNLKLLKEWETTHPTIKPLRRPLDGWKKFGAVTFLAKHSEGAICDTTSMEEQPGVRVTILLKNAPDIQKFVNVQGHRDLNEVRNYKQLKPCYAFDCRQSKTVQINDRRLQVAVFDYGVGPKPSPAKPK